MFAPKRSMKDRQLLDAAHKWLQSEQLQHDLKPLLMRWSSDVFKSDRPVEALRLDLSTVYADVDLRGRHITADGTIDLVIDPQGEGREEWRLPATVRLHILDDAARSAAVDWISVDARAFDRQAAAAE